MMRACIDRQPPGLAHYVIVRSDLPLGVQIANVVHAAGESVATALHDGTIAVALHVPNEHTLREIATALGAASLTHKLIVETEGAHAGAAMSIGVQPTTDRESVRKVLSKLPLAR